MYESAFGLTSLIEWQLVGSCEQDSSSTSSYSYLLQTFYMLGSIFSLVIGYLSDRYGRKCVSLVLLGLIALTIGSSQLLIVLFSLAVPLRYAIYSTSKFLLGMLCVALFSITYVLLFEFTARRHVTMASNINVYMFVVGELVVAAISYFSRNWHVINWSMSAFALIILLLAVYFLPESPRFLIVHERYTQLYADLRRIALVNGRRRRFEQMNERDVIESLVENFHNQDNNRHNDDIENGKPLVDTLPQQFTPATPPRESIIRYLIKSRRLLFARVFLLGFVWFSISFVYFGVSLGKFRISFNFIC